ncbi:MAG: hypothetical protein CSB46_05910 [Micrococcales bacterium]|nr:MAG: hypothetical protein CSB46_05910 [Micrococcales bacterium]
MCYSSMPVFGGRRQQRFGLRQVSATAGVCQDSPVRFVLPTVGSAAIAALISVASLAGPAGVMLVALALVILLAAGWPQLLRLAAPAGSSVVVGACGAAAVLVVGLTAQRSLSWAHNLTWLTPVLAMSVIAAFLHQLTRTDGRAHLVESVTGVVSGIMVAAMAAGWAATAARPGGSAVMLAVTCPMTVVALVLALAAPGRGRRWVTPLVGVLGAVCGAVLGSGTPHVGLAYGSLAGLLVGLAASYGCAGGAIAYLIATLVG